MPAEMEMTLKHSPERSNFDRLLSHIESDYQKEELSSGWFKLAVLFFNANSHKKWSGLDAGEMLRLCSAKKQLSKSEMCAVAFSIFRHEDSFRDFWAGLPPYISSLVEQLTWEKWIDRKSVEAVTNMDILIPSQSSWRPPELKKEFKIFNVQFITDYGYQLNHDKLRYVLFLPLSVREMLATHMPKPAGYFIIPAAQPTDEKLRRFNAEESINRELPALITYYQQDQIKYSEKGKPASPGMKKLQRTLLLTEFFTDGDFMQIRSMLMAGLIYGYKPEVKSLHLHDTIKGLFEKRFLKAPAAHYILNSLKGFNYFQFTDYELSANQDIMAVLRNLREGQWVTSENLHRYVQTHFMDLAPVSNWKLVNKVTYEIPGVNGYGGRSSFSSSEFPQFVYRPMLAGAIFLFAAFGLLEISYNDARFEGQPGKDWFSEYDGLKAVKLTALGAYVLGLRNDYEPLHTETDDKLTLEENSLVIRVQGNPELAHVRLNNFAQKVSGNRYQFSQSLFLRDCKKEADIVNKIALFRQSIAQELPPIWETQLKRLVTNSSLIKKASKMLVFKLPAEDKELHRFLVQDETMKKLLIKAEQYYILVPSDKETLFKARLKEAGILLE